MVKGKGGMGERRKGKRRKGKPGKENKRQDTGGGKEETGNGRLELEIRKGTGNN